MDLILSGPEAYRGQPVLDQPIGVQAAVGKHGVWLHTDGFRRAYPVLDGRRIGVQVERGIGVGRYELEFSGPPVRVLDFRLSFLERLAEALRDGMGKGQIRAARFPLDVNVVGDDVGGVASRL